MADQRPWMVRWMVRSADLRRCAFGLEKACSIGLKACPRLDQGSGLQGGRKRSVAPAASIRSRATGPLWLDRLSMITTSPGFGSGTRTWLTQARKGRGRRRGSSSTIAGSADDPFCRTAARAAEGARPCRCGVRSLSSSSVQTARPRAAARPGGNGRGGAPCWSRPRSRR